MDYVNKCRLCVIFLFSTKSVFECLYKQICFWTSAMHRKFKGSVSIQSVYKKQGAKWCMLNDMYCTRYVKYFGFLYLTAEHKNSRHRTKTSFVMYCTVYTVLTSPVFTSRISVIFPKLRIVQSFRKICQYNLIYFTNSPLDCTVLIHHTRPKGIHQT